MIQKRINVSHMQCWLIRLAQSKWNKTKEEIADLFMQHGILDYIAECYDTLHLCAYQHILAELESMFARKGIALPDTTFEIKHDSIGGIDNTSVTNETKQACSIETMRYMLQNYAQDKGIPFEDALLTFTTSSTYQVLFDFETEVWKEGPDYLRSLFEKALINK